MSWSEEHRQSELHAWEADRLFNTGEAEGAAREYRLAAEAEERALRLVEVSKRRTFGITAVSAAALYRLAHLPAEAERLAHWSLATGLAPEFYRGELCDLLAAIWEEQRRAELAESTDAPAQLDFSLSGDAVAWGSAPASAVHERVHSATLFLHRVIERCLDAPYRTAGALPLALRQAFPLRIVQLPAGSYRFGLAIEQPLQAMLFEPPAATAHDVVETALRILSLCSAEPASHVEEIDADPQYRRTFLRLVMRLAPAGSGLSQLSVQDGRGTQQITLSRSTRGAIHAVLGSGGSPAEGEGDEPEIRGVLRAVSLEHDWLEVVDEQGASTKVYGVDESVDDQIGPFVNRRVVVYVSTPSDGQGAPRFVDIEPDE